VLGWSERTFVEGTLGSGERRFGREAGAPLAGKRQRCSKRDRGPRDEQIERGESVAGRRRRRPSVELTHAHPGVLDYFVSGVPPGSPRDRIGSIASSGPAHRRAIEHASHIPVVADRPFERGRTNDFT
jgi:hypothetical protein